MKQTIKSITGAAVAILCLAGCGNGSKTQSAPVEESLSKVKIMAVQAQDVPQTDVYQSNVQANVVNNIAPQSGSRIQKLRVDVGDYVNAGQILAEMDRVNLEQTRLKLSNDSTELGRVRDLYNEGGISKSDYEALELAYNVSKTTYENLLENTILRAPVSGVITARNYDRGDMYTMSQPLFVLQQITPVKLLVGITESNYTKVRKGDEVTITVDAIPGRTFTGRINKLYPTMDPTTHTFLTEVIVPNSDRALKPGMYARVTVSYGDNHSIVVPDDAVVKQQGSAVRNVFVLNDDGTVTARVVKTGVHFGNSFEILEGLSEGENIVVKGQNSLRSGDKVEVIR
ncbi:MAG: efflux RND transporter periplasmic adaptor subunit [Candidatus Cryptobacteroides sp.]